MSIETVALRVDVSCWYGLCIFGRRYARSPAEGTVTHHHDRFVGARVTSCCIPMASNVTTTSRIRMGAFLLMRDHSMIRL